MVYRGRPSQGCLTCRKRKIRCDQTPGGCLNCAKAKRPSPCPGYRNQLDLAFHNETSDVVRKVEKSYGYSPRERSPQQVGIITIGPALGQSLDELGETFFFTSYIVYPHTDRGRKLAREEDLIGGELDGLLRSCTTAVGLAGWARLAGLPDVMVQAKKRYVDGIQKTNEALTWSEGAKRDSTLVATMLLSSFETISGDSEPSLAAWENHVRGGAALLKFRGTSQFETFAGIRLFLAAVGNVLPPCVRHGLPVPPAIMELLDELKPRMNPKDVGWQQLHASIKYANFQAAVKSGQISTPDERLQRARDLDAIAQGIYTDLDPQWNYTASHTDKSFAEDTDGLFHFYPNFLSAQMWNIARSLRLRLQEHVRAALSALESTPDHSYLDADFALQRMQSWQSTSKLELDVMASVYQCLGRVSTRGEPQDTDWTASPTEYQFLWSNFERRGYYTEFLRSHTARTPQYPSLRLIGGYGLLWALSVIGRGDITPRRRKEWVIGVLRRIGSTCGIAQAFTIANEIERILRDDGD